MAEHDSAPTKKDYEELTAAFARILYAWKFPDVLTTPIEEHSKAIRTYFHSDPMAYHVLKSLVVTAMRSRGEDQRQQVEVLAYLPRQCEECRTIHLYIEGCPLQEFRSDLAVGDIIVDDTRGLGPRSMPYGLPHDE